MYNKIKTLAIIFLFFSKLLFSSPILSDIYVPESYEELKRLYIKAVQLYYSESDAHKNTMKIVNSLESQNSNLRFEIKNIIANGNYSRPMKEHFFSFSIGSFYKDENPVISFGASYFYLFNERWIIGIDTVFPLFIGSRIGVGF